MTCAWRDAGSPPRPAAALSGGDFAHCSAARTSRPSRCARRSVMVLTSDGRGDDAPDQARLIHHDADGVGGHHARRRNRRSDATTGSATSSSVSSWYEQFSSMKK